MTTQTEAEWIEKMMDLAERMRWASTSEATAIWATAIRAHLATRPAPKLTDAMLEAGVEAQMTCFAESQGDCTMPDVRRAMVAAGWAAMISAATGSTKP